MVLIHQRAPPAKGDHPQNWRATDPSTSGYQPHNWSSRRYFLNIEFGGHALEVSSTSRTMASRRSVPRVTLRPVGGCGTGDAITVRFPFVCCPQYGVLWYFFFSASWWCIFTFRPPRRAGPSSKDGKGATSLWCWSLRTSRRVCFRVTRRGPLALRIHVSVLPASLLR